MAYLKPEMNWLQRFASDKKGLYIALTIAGFIGMFLGGAIAAGYLG